MPGGRGLTRRELLLGGAAAAALAGLGAVALLEREASSPSATRRTPSPPTASPSPPIAVNPNLPQRPVFADRHFDVLAFGARPDGSGDSSAAVRAAIAACAAAGGGHVLVPPGVYACGPIALAGGVDLHLETGAVLRFSTDPRAYLPAVLTRWAGIELLNYSPLVRALDAQDIGVTGDGTLDGGSDESHWWSWAGGLESPDVTALEALAARGVPVAQRVFGGGHHLRPAFVEPYRCSRVLVSGVTIVNAPFWVVHPTLCEDVTVENVTVRSPAINNDGCDPESCNRVLITGCKFDTGDDCVAIKSGRDADGRRLGVPSQHILVEDCDLQGPFAGLAIGSEMSGGVRDVVARNLRAPGRLESAVFIKSNSRRGGFVERIDVSDVWVAKAKFGLRIDLGYGAGPGHGFDPAVKDVSVRRLRVESCDQGLALGGLPTSHLSRIAVTDCSFGGVSSRDLVQYADQVTLAGVTE